MSKPIKQAVEKWVNDVSYEEDPNYIPSTFALEFVTFIKLVNGGTGEENRTPVLHYKMLDEIAGKKQNITNMIHRGAAKALTLDTKLIGINGLTTMGDVAVGDLLYDRNGMCTEVTHKSEVFYKRVFRITLADGRWLDVSEDHINIVKKRKTGKGVPAGLFGEYTLTTNEIIQKGVHYRRKRSDRNPKGKEAKWFIPTGGMVSYSRTDVPLDPYLVGCILGDGSIDKKTGFTRFHTHIDDVEEFRGYMKGYDLSDVRTDKRRPDTVRYSIKKIGSKVKEFIGTTNVYGKRIPANLMYGSSIQRYEVLRGLMDTDGTVDIKGNSSFTSVSLGLAEDVASIVRSLGGESKVVTNTWGGRTSYRVQVKTAHNCFNLKRKAGRWKYKMKSHTAIESITQIASVPTQCISVDSHTHSFMANDYIVTHNTTIMGEYLFLYLAVYGGIPGFGKVPLAIYVSDSIENGVKNMRKNLEYRWQNSDFLQKYVPKTRFTDVRYEFTNVDGSVLVVKGYGAKTGVRGAKEMGQRPYLAVLDDLVSDEDARSATVIASIEDTVYKAIDYALHPSRRKTIWSGTPFNAKDPLYKAVESGAWYTSVYPVCERFPCTREEFRGSWEDRFNYDYVKAQYDKAMLAGKIDTFNQEMMLRIMSEEDRLVQDNDIVWYGRDNLLANKSWYNFYITTDFATSEKTSADFSVISVWAYNNNGDWLWVDGVIKRQLMDQNIDDLFRFVSMYKPQGVGIEVTGQQGGFIQWVQDQMLQRNIFFNLTSEGNNNKPGVRPNTNKMVRFNTVLPLFKAKKVWFPKELKDKGAMIEIMDELKNASASGFKSKHDDFIDTVSMLSVMNPWKPSEEASSAAKQDDEGVYTVDYEEEAYDTSYDM